jgi:alkylation response protein AidB-like acyl-CoA dehydrogenase
MTLRVAGRAADLDGGRTDVRGDITAMGRAGLFDSAFRDDGLPTLIHVIDDISAHSLAVGFSAWAHAMTLHYLLQAPATLREKHVESLRIGTRIGVTALAAGLKHAAGLEDMPLIAHRSGNSVCLSGLIPWASNVFDDALVVLPARGSAGETYIAALDVGTAGVVINPAPTLMALGSTASTSLRLERVCISSGQIISTDLHAFLKRIRPILLLSQTAFCIGAGRAAIAGARNATGVLAAQFAAEVAALSEHIAALRDRLYAFAVQLSQRHIVDLIRLRLDTTTAAVAATRLECTLSGGAGYATNFAANRRFREAAFLPIQSPSEGHLRWELQRYAQRTAGDPGPTR